jgi:galactokinase
VARAPGRVNLIGEHTDYNEGFVLPAGIDREMLIAADTKSAENTIELYSLEYNESYSFSVEQIKLTEEHYWSNYVKGVVDVLQKQTGHLLGGFRAILSGTVPQGAGLSSSAALEVATGTLLNRLANLSLDGREIALLAQKAENDFVGLKCGIMDQFVSALAQPDAAILIDCRDLSYKTIPLHLAEQSVSLVITHTGVRRGLAASKYNERRAECEEGLQILKAKTGNDLRSLRDVDDALLHEHIHHLPDTIARRVRHVVSENDRVLDAANLLSKGELKRFGHLMVASHNSLRDDYEVSCVELDKLVELSLKAKGCLGARMTGAGFGGCTVALFEQDGVADFMEAVLPEYERQTQRTPNAYVCAAAAGAGLI